MDFKTTYEHRLDQIEKHRKEQEALNRDHMETIISLKLKLPNMKDSQEKSETQSSPSQLFSPSNDDEKEEMSDLSYYNSPARLAR